MRNVRRRHSKIIAILLVVVFVSLLSFVLYQSSNQYETIYAVRPNIARKVLSKGDTVTLGWKSKLMDITIGHIGADGFTTREGTEIHYSDIAFLRKGERVSVPSMQWNANSDNLARLKEMLAQGQAVHLILKVPPPFSTIIADKTDQGITTSSGKFIHYDQIGFVKKKIPIYAAFPGTLLRDILFLPALLLWSFVDLLAAFGMH